MTTAGGIVGEFFDLKRETDADLLAMQCGDFYEFFDDDAETVANELDLKVSQKSSHGSSYAMAGVPVDDLTPYLTALVERGYRVAVADQYETENGHAREITRVVTPGTLIETGDADAQYLGAVVYDDDEFGVAFADVTTGQFHVTECVDESATDELLTELYRFDPVELLPGPTLRNKDELLGTLRERTSATLTLHATDAFAPGRARHQVREQFGDETLESVGVAESDLAVQAAGAVLSYVDESGAGVLASMTRLQSHGSTDHVELDATTQRNLELTETMQGDRSGSLLDTIDHTVTSAGRRLLAEWLRRPRQSRGELLHRQSAVAALTEAVMARERIQEELDGSYDLERLASRAASGSANARDLRAAAETLSVLPALVHIVEETDRLAESELATALDRPDQPAADTLATKLDEAIVDDPPGTISQGGLIRTGYDDELDEIVEQHEEALTWIETLADREKQKHNITHLSVDRNKTDGYYIQVGNSEADQVPDAYEQIKSLKNSERFTIPELEEHERDILRLEEQRHDLERDIFEDLRAQVARAAETLQAVGRALAKIDVFVSLATHAVRNDWTRPELHDDNRLDIESGRHPVVEQTTEFVPNDLRLDDDRRFLVVTGPNMSGKSTYMRQAALITLLAQVGSFVPARQAAIGLVDGIYTRVGALDELAQGRSTFMVEMQELSNILHSATEDSLVILDEVGRGTATYDGISIAWAATEYLHNMVRAKTLFATHYHELTSLSEHLGHVENVHVAVDGEPRSSSTGAPHESDGDVTFLRTVRDGPTDRSYGVHVADLAGVPEPVVDRSREVLERLREEKAIEAKGGDTDSVQTVFDLGSGQFKTESSTDQSVSKESDDIISDNNEETAPRAETRSNVEQDVLDAVLDLDVTQTPPVEVIQQVQQWQNELEQS
ncbi:DNA mismatch repair protein MutS [Halovenus rubra]|uniref:DNA mismatch repair protein MutS n=2 Tax=Halovenus rubra TaxID=869890 RepID=A0ABD5X5C7_9EURY|nr:DNA mismatch repair protein MutS [Halovenus rubra]